MLIKKKDTDQVSEFVCHLTSHNNMVYWRHTVVHNILKSPPPSRGEWKIYEKREKINQKGACEVNIEVSRDLNFRKGKRRIFDEIYRHLEKF
jgi:hypothetical protein